MWQLVLCDGTPRDETRGTGLNKTHELYGMRLASDTVNLHETEASLYTLRDRGVRVELNETHEISKLDEIPTLHKAAPAR